MQYTDCERGCYLANWLSYLYRTLVHVEADFRMQRESGEGASGTNMLVQHRESPDHEEAFLFPCQDASCTNKFVSR